MDHQPIDSYQQMEQSSSHSGVALPYDEAPFEATLLPGQMIKLYGNIKVQNDTEEPCYVIVRFDLRKGFILTVEGINSPAAFETRISMHSHHAVKIIDGQWQLFTRNQG